MSSAGKVLGMVRRGVLVASKLTSGALRQLQAKVDGTTVDDVELMEPYGMASVAPAGSHVLILHVGGDESHPIAVAVASTAHRPTDLTEGQYAIYDSTGKVIKLSTVGIQLGTGATKGVARTGDAISVSQQTFLDWMTAVTAATGVPAFVGSPTGTITSGSATVKAVD